VSSGQLGDTPHERTSLRAKVNYRDQGVVQIDLESISKSSSGG